MNLRTFSFLTFALVSGVGGQGVAIETLLAAVAEEAVSVVDALEALSGLAVAVADGVGVDVVAALAGTARSDRTVLTQRVPEEPVVAELAAFTCRQVTAETRTVTTTTTNVQMISVFDNLQLQFFKVNMMHLNLNR